MQHYDIIIIGGGAAGLMAAYGAASGRKRSVLVLEKMPRPGRKIVITGKGRCNFTNMKDWSDFAPHIRSNSNVLRAAFYNLTPERLLEFFERQGLASVVERGDRVFPASHRSMDVVDALVNAAVKSGARIETDAQVSEIHTEDCSDGKIFTVCTVSGKEFSCSKLIIATGGLSYPGTGSTGDGYRFGQELGHTVTNCFPSLTALVPEGYKLESPGRDSKFHIDRSLPLSDTGGALCGCSLKNVGVRLEANGSTLQEMEGDIDFTDGGIEGPAGFAVSRNAVKSLINGSEVVLHLDLKPGVPQDEFAERTAKLWDEVQKDPRSRGKSARVIGKILIGKLLPWELIPGFLKCHPEIYSGNKGREVLKLKALVNGLRDWSFPIAGYVGYERCVITAGGISCSEIIPKTLESRKCPGLYFCGEVLDIDADTGGYNLHTAFATGLLAGESAAK